MARPREFDADIALNKAMRLFWEQGYQATSLQDLMKAVGVKKQSLYGAFGDKRSLFLKCLSLYAQQTFVTVQAMLNATDTPLNGIKRVLHYASRPAESRNCPAGCLMTNTALELAQRDPEIAEEVRRMFRGFEEILVGAVRRAQEVGEISKNVDSATVGQSLANTINGIRVLEKTGAPQRQVKAVVDAALASIQR
jgi:TetR/AcrR family transcriptional regulator, transcriptional repressor for nem operon